MKRITFLAHHRIGGFVLTFATVIDSSVWIDKERECKNALAFETGSVMSERSYHSFLKGKKEKEV